MCNLNARIHFSREATSFLAPYCPFVRNLAARVLDSRAILPTCSGVCLCVLGSACVFRVLPACSGVCLRVPGSAYVFWGLPTCSWVCLHVLESACVFWGLPACSGFCLRVLGSACMFWGLPTFAASSSHSNSNPGVLMADGLSKAALAQVALLNLHTSRNDQFLNCHEI